MFARARPGQHRPAREDLGPGLADGVGWFDSQVPLERRVGVDDPPRAVADDDGVGQSGDQRVARQRRQIEEARAEQPVGNDQVGDAEHEWRRITLAEHTHAERERHHRRHRRQRQTDEDEQHLAQLRRMLAHHASHQQRRGCGDREEPVGRERPVEPRQLIVERDQRQVVAQVGVGVDPARRHDLDDERRSWNQEQYPPRHAAGRLSGVGGREPEATDRDADARRPLQSVEEHLAVDRRRQQLADVERRPDRVRQRNRRERERSGITLPSRERGDRRDRRHHGGDRERNDPSVSHGQRANVRSRW